ncbi:MAG: DUF3347 domain-containing protein [Deltaproteobacteria bacterium]|nr:DUF3347 domain-containing protein [Deltaproteobacteria bacterium]
MSKWMAGFASAVVAAAMVTTVAAPGQVAAAEQGDWPKIIKSYDAVREALSKDDAAAAQKAAKAAEPGLKGLHGDAATVKALQAAAAKVAGTADLKLSRMAFGEWSRGLITLVAAEPQAQKGVLAFQCTMTKTYQKWLQLAEPLANPYWGSQMLRCGNKVAIAP